MPKNLLDTALDTISRVLGVDCCWVQLITASNNGLSLSACCGFTSDMQHKMATMDLSHPLGQQVVGIGSALVIPDLSQNGHFDMSLFEEAGFRSLIAVPVLTYRPYGIMGVAYRTTKRFTKADSDLFTVIAGVIGMALNKCVLIEQASLDKTHVPNKVRPSLLPTEDAKTQKPELLETGVITTSQQPQRSQPPENSGAYAKHLQRMNVFRSAHRDGA